jgi:hypothetical protein
MRQLRPGQSLPPPQTPAYAEGVVCLKARKSASEATKTQPQTASIDAINLQRGIDRRRQEISALRRASLAFTMK